MFELSYLPPQSIPQDMCPVIIEATASAKTRFIKTPLRQITQSPQNNDFLVVAQEIITVNVTDS